MTETSVAREEIEKSGYFCSFKELSMPKYKCLIVDLRVKLFAYDLTDIHVDDIDSQNLEWVRRIVLSSRPDSDNEWEFVDREWNDYHPSTNTGIVKTYIYYLKMKCPPEGTVFESVNENGGVDQMEIKNGTIYCNGLALTPVEKWDQYDTFV